MHRTVEVATAQGWSNCFLSGFSAREGWEMACGKPWRVAASQYREHGSRRTHDLAPPRAASHVQQPAVCGALWTVPWARQGHFLWSLIQRGRRESCDWLPSWACPRATERCWRDLTQGLKPFLHPGPWGAFVSLLTATGNRPEGQRLSGNQSGSGNLEPACSTLGSAEPWGADPSVPHGGKQDYMRRGLRLDSNLSHDLGLNLRVEA